VGRTMPWLGRGAASSIRVLVASPDTIFGEALSTYLDDRDGIEVVGLTFDADVLPEAVDVLRPGVLVCDQRAATPVAPVLDACRRRQEDLRTVLLATMAAPVADDEHSSDGVVPPRSSLDRVVATVREVAWHRNPAGAPVAAPAPSLTGRELEVLRLVGHGEGTDDIARTLHLSPHTVRNHIRRISGKLETNSRIESVTVARRHGIL
jgi:two-component system, NarL family, response regulator DesR